MAAVWRLPAVMVRLCAVDEQGTLTRFPMADGLRGANSVRKYVNISTGARLAIEVKFDLEKLPIENLFPGDILRISYRLDGVQCRDLALKKEEIISKGHDRVLCAGFTKAHKEAVFQKIPSASHLTPENATMGPRSCGKVVVVISHQNIHYDPSAATVTRPALVRPLLSNPAFSLDSQRTAGVSHYIDFTNTPVSQLLSPGVVLLDAPPADAPIPASGAWKTTTIGQPGIFEFFCADAQTMPLVFNAPVAIPAANPPSVHGTGAPQAAPQTCISVSSAGTSRNHTSIKSETNNTMDSSIKADPEGLAARPLHHSSAGGTSSSPRTGSRAAVTANQGIETEADNKFSSNSASSALDVGGGRPPSKKRKVGEIADTGKDDAGPVKVETS